MLSPTMRLLIYYSFISGFTVVCAFLRATFELSTSQGASENEIQLLCARKCARDLECSDFRVDATGSCDFTTAAKTGSKVYKAIEKPEVCSEETDGTLTAYDTTFRGRATQTVCYGSWILLQRRANCITSFDQNWQIYKDGFGDYLTDFWYGLEAMHVLTSSKAYRASFEMTTSTGETKTANYESFNIASEGDKYRLDVSGYSGDAGDSLASAALTNDWLANGRFFSTPDRDNDLAPAHCAAGGRSGWWFNHCTSSRLNFPCPNQPGFDCANLNCMTWYPIPWQPALNGSRIKIQMKDVQPM